jgi:hypothetical protein
MILSLRNEAGLKSLVAQLYEPSSPLYRHYVQPSQFYALYGPDPAELAALTKYMQLKGLQVHQSANNPLLVELTGTVSQVQDALKTKINSFSWNGKTFYSATSQARLPSQFSNIQMIYGLENLDSQSGSTGAVPMYRTLGTVSPSQTPNNFMYYSPSEIQQMYNATALSGYDGTGVEIAIIDAYGDPYIGHEVGDFSAQFGIPNATLNIIPIGPYYNPDNGTTYGWNTEIALDVEWAHAMAPGATINLYISSDNGFWLYIATAAAILGMDSSYTPYVYPNGIISMSWGEPENDFASSMAVGSMSSITYPWLNQVFLLAAAFGITAFASTGDQGAYDQGYPLYQTSPYGGAGYPATDPYVTGVGGTALYMNATSGYYQWPYTNATGETPYGNETAWSWNNYYEWATGGGWSTLFGQPPWQTGPGVVNNGERGAPDVAWDADVQTGVLVSVYNPSTDSYDYWIVGGTSVGSPCWAGSMALIDQKAGYWLGCINPTIYSILNNNAEYSKTFHDITIGNNNPDSATIGWDPLTGVGSPNLGELADYLTQTGEISVLVFNDFSYQAYWYADYSYLGRAYAYGQIVNLTAYVSYEGELTSVTASITSSTGATIASGITMTYDGGIGAYLGSYTIQPADPSGEWTATVTATGDSVSGQGCTTFAVGDGVTIDNPPYYTGQQFYQVGDIIQVMSYVTNTSGNYVIEGAYTATFYFAQNQVTGNGLGNVEGKIALAYNAITEYWEGNFTVPSGVDQGAWILVVNGTDLNGNKGSAYTWINVGLDISVFTDLPTYLLGDEISIFAIPAYEDGSEVQTGTFTATIYDGPTLVGTVPLTFKHNTGLGLEYDIMGLWMGTFTTSLSNPTGFYNITVSGTDGKGNSGSFATIVRVAQHALSVDASVSNPIVPLTGGTESYVLARITYPDDSPMTMGNVIGFMYQNYGGGIMSLVHTFRMTYNSTAGGFVAVNLLQTIDWTTSMIGNYTIDVEAYDPVGNYGWATASFFVAGEVHAPIQISSDSDFTFENGVVAGDGSSGNPYVIAGWDVSSISITNVYSWYMVYNDYVSGSDGNGITIYTPNSEPIVAFLYAVHNNGYGVYINGSYASVCYYVTAGDNGKDGILIANDTEAYDGGAAYCIAYNNAFNGIVFESSDTPFFYYDEAVGNALVGLLSQDSIYPQFYQCIALDNFVGIEVTAQLDPWYGPYPWYGVASIQQNDVEQNAIGIYVDGLNQNLTTAEYYGIPSNATVYDNYVVQNGIGIYACDQAVLLVASISSEQDIAENNVGILIEDSSAFVFMNYLVLNTEYGIETVGTGIFNWTLPFMPISFKTLLGANEVYLTGNYDPTSGSGISINDSNDSFVFMNDVQFSRGNGIELNNVKGFLLGEFTGIMFTSILVAQNTVSNNTMNGIYANNATLVLVGLNDVKGNMQNGAEIIGGSNNTIGSNWWEGNAQCGVLLCGGTKFNYFATFASTGGRMENASFNHYGFEIADSSWNMFDDVYAGNNTGTAGSPGVGIFFGAGATNNEIFNRSDLFFNDVGVEFNNCHSNIVYNCSIEFNTMYGFYFVWGAHNEYTGNILLGNGADYFPTLPTLTLTSPTGGSTVAGTVSITWTESAYPLAFTTLTIDAISTNVTGLSYSWNTMTYTDGSHTVTVNVTNTGGFSAAQSVSVFTENPPATINNLAASSSTANSITLTWTAPGDNGMLLGTAAGYVVKYSTSGPITSLNWASATTYAPASGWTPLSPGQTETHSVSGLKNATRYWFALEAYDLAGNYGAVSNSPSRLTSDAYPPAAITDLATSNPTTSSITLTWTAVGDNGTIGTATGYWVKYSTLGPITALNWASATNFTQSWIPLSAGSAESHIVTGLYSNTTYWFAIKAYDAAHNYGGVSNSPSRRTLGVSLVTTPGFFGQNGFGISTNGSNVVVTSFTTQPSGTGTLPSGLKAFIYFEMTGSLVPGSHTALVLLYYNRTIVQQLGLNETTLSLYTWNSVTSEWEAISGTVTVINSTTGVITAYLSHFSYFAVFGSAPSAAGLGVTTIIMMGGAVAVVVVLVLIVAVVKRRGTPTKIQ